MMLDMAVAHDLQCAVCEWYRSRSSLPGCLHRGKSLFQPGGPRGVPSGHLGDPAAERDHVGVRLGGHVARLGVGLAVHVAFVLDESLLLVEEDLVVLEDGVLVEVRPPSGTSLKKKRGSAALKMNGNRAISRHRPGWWHRVHHR